MSDETTPPKPPESDEPAEPAAEELAPPAAEEAAAPPAEEAAPPAAEEAAPPPPPTDPPPAEPPPPPPPGGASGGGGQSSNRTLMLWLAYAWPLAFVPFLAEKDDAEIQWHAKHGLVLTAAEVLVWIVLMVGGNMIGCLGCFIGPVFGLGVLVLHVMEAVKAVQGERLELPLLSDLVDQF